MTTTHVRVEVTIQERRIAIDKRIKTLIKDLEAQGWECKPTKSGWICYPPDIAKQGVAIHRTPSDHRWYANCMKLLRASGFQE